MPGALQRWQNWCQFKHLPAGLLQNKSWHVWFLKHNGQFAVIPCRNALSVAALWGWGFDETNLLVIHVLSPAFSACAIPIASLCWTRCFRSQRVKQFSAIIPCIKASKKFSVWTIELKQIVLEPCNQQDMGKGAATYSWDRHDCLLASMKKIIWKIPSKLKQSSSIATEKVVPWPDFFWLSCDTMIAKYFLYPLAFNH